MLALDYPDGPVSDDIEVLSEPLPAPSAETLARLRQQLAYQVDHFEKLIF